MKKGTILFPSILASLIGLVGSTFETVAQDPLDSWVTRSLPGSIMNMGSIAFGNGSFVAVGDASAVARSTNGVNWTVGTAGAYGNLKRVRFLNGEFVVVGASDKMLVSSDGVSWTPRTLPGAGFQDVAFGNGVYILAGASTYLSTDGMAWTQTHPTVAGNERSLTSVLFGNGGFLGLSSSLGFGSFNGRSVFSTNGVDWIIGSPCPLGDTELIFGDGKSIMTVDQSVDFNYGGVTLSTNNGASWCCQFFATFGGNNGGALAFGQGTFIYVENSVRARVYSSTNGTSWTLRYWETNSAAGRGATFGNGTFVVVGIDGTGAGYILQSGNISGTPTIAQEPQDRGVVVGNPAGFSVQVAGAPTLAYQWYKDGSPLANATNSTYSLANVQISDVGGYQAVIANSVGSVTSRVAQLTVAFLGIDCYAGIKILGAPGRTYRVEATPASGAQNWQTLTNVVLPSSPYVWIDMESPSLPARLYRAAELP